jgi:hypothetical protein
LLIGLPPAHAFDVDEVSARFGADVATIVAGVARMDEIRTLPHAGDANERAAQAERLRKMLLAMVEDIRVVLIKLAERTQALRFLMSADVMLRQQAAREVLDLFRAARQSAGCLAVEVGTGRSVVARTRARAIQGDCKTAGRAPARPSTLHRGRRRDRPQRVGCGAHRRPM